MSNKKLYIIRHAKAEEHSFSKSDFERHLISKGKERAERIALELAGELQIDEQTLFISSTANRALETAHIFADILGYSSAAIQLERDIYEAHHRDILKVINSVPSSFQKVLVFGHNPGLSDLVDYLTDRPVDLKTANIAIIELPANFDFAHVSANSSNLIKVLA